METEPSQPGLISREPSFSSYCSNIQAELVSMDEASEQHHVDYDFEFDWLPESKNVLPPIEKQGEKVGSDRFVPHLCPCLQQNHAEQVNEEKVVVMEKKFSSTSSSTGSDRSENKFFPIHDPEIVPHDKKQHENIAFMKEGDDSAPSEEVKYKKSRSTGYLLTRWNSLTGLLRRSSSERRASRSTNNSEEGKENSSVFSRCFSLKSRSNNTEGKKLGEKLGCDGFIHHLCPCLQPANSLPVHAEEVDEEKAVVMMENKFSSESSSTGSANRVFPIHDPESETVDKNQRDNVEVMMEHDDSISAEVEKSEEVEHKIKSKSTGTLSRRWSSFKGLLRRSSSERRALRSTEEGMEDSFILLRCFSLSSRSSSSTVVEEGEKLKSEGCMLYLCPCLASPPANSMPRPKEADQDKEGVKEKKPTSKCYSTAPGSTKSNKSADLGKVDGYSKRSKIQNNAHKVYLKRNSKGWEASSPYRVDTIRFSAMVRSLMFFTASASVSASA